MDARALTLADVEAAVRALYARLGAGEGAMPTFGHTVDGAHPHVEADERGLHLVTIERGQELDRFTTTDLDALLDRIGVGAAFGMACDWELHHRQPHRDVRRMIFARQVETLRRVSDAWADREAARHADILREHPFDDLAGERADLTRRLRESGLADDDAWAKACARYPLPDGDR